MSSPAHRPPPSVHRPPGSGLVLGGERPAEVVAFEAELVDFFVEAADLLGVPKSVAAIYGIVFASPVPLSFAEIEGRLDVSKGSVSQGLKVLREVGALKEVSKPEDRAELFEPDLEMRKLLDHYLQNRLERQLASGRGRLAAISRSLPGRNGGAAVLRQRVKKLQTWHDRTRALMPLVRGFLKLGK